MKIDTNKYSVLMSLYKDENPEFLKEAIDSMLYQTVPPEQIVIVEDGPLTEELYYALSAYQEIYPDIFTYVINKTNLGLGMALNKGLKVCRNEFVARMDTDDISKAARCEKQLKLFNKKPHLSIVGTYIDEFSLSTDYIISKRVVPTDHEDIYRYAKRRSAFNHPSVMYKKSEVLKQGGYSDLRRNQDVDLFGRMLYSGCKGENIGESLLWFRTSKDLARRRKSWENTKSYINTIRRFWKDGYSTFWDFSVVAIAQIGMFICPKKLQFWIYKILLR